MKNGFILALRDYLQSKYSTQSHYTLGESDFEGKIGGGYNLVRRDPNKPKDISGFVFRKDLCDWTPKNETDIINDVHKFSLNYKSLENVLSDDRKTLSIKFGNSDYLVNAHIGGGYAGELSVYFVNMSFVKTALINFKILVPRS